MDRERTHTWRFDLMLRVPLLYGREDVCALFRSILDQARDRIAINGLDQSSFAYDVPDEGGLVRISGYLHSTAQIWHSSVKTWIFDERVIGEIEWRAVQPGPRQDWRKHDLIKDIFIQCECESGILLLEDWEGNSSLSVNKGGRPRKAPVLADGGEGGAAEAATAPRPRGRPRKPPPVDTDTPQQAAVRDRLIRLDAVNVQRLCSTLFPGDRSWTGKTKYQQVDMLMKHHDFDRLARTLEVATTVTGAGADDCARRAREAPRKAVSSANIQELRYICNHIKLDYHLCVDKSDYPGLFQGKVDAEYITEAVRIIRACGTTWITTRPALPPPRDGTCAAGTVTAVGPLPPPPPPPPPPPLGAAVGG